jgi:hypothetical protein
MASFVKHSGFVIATPHSNLVKIQDISQETLLEISRLLGVDKLEPTKRLKDESIRTIFIYAPDKS